MAADSRTMIGGSLFVCMPSASRDSHDLLLEVASKGAVAAITHSSAGYEKAVELGLAAAFIPPDRFEDASWRIAREAFDDPSRRMQLVGITGTNGKTTTAWLVRDLMQSMGIPAGYLGTLGLQTPAFDRELANTTPFAIELYALLDEAAEAGCKALAFEVSSHALAQHRADGLSLSVAAFTNLTQDHLDFHGSMDAYAAAKKRLFTDFEVGSSVFNADDPQGVAWAAELGGKTFGASPSCDFRYESKKIAIDAIAMEVNGRAFALPLGGEYNVWNAAAAFAIVREMGAAEAQIAHAMEHVRPVRGRFEPVPNARGIGIIVDYAHTPDALTKLLETARPLVSGRVITVFGCGGDRDRAKRPLMAQAAGAGSDIVIVTSDNPRTENAEAIIDEVMAGFDREEVEPEIGYGAVGEDSDPIDMPARRGGIEIHRIPARPEAIRRAIELAEPGDAVIIAGKGHEDYQIIGKEKIHMDDRELVAKAME